MNKILKIFVVFCVFFTILSIDKVNATNVDMNGSLFMASKEDINKFTSLQNEITSHLILDGNKYKYDKDEISKLIDNSDVNFSVFNITKEKFKELVFENINNYKKYYSERATTCGLNKSENGWNYVRTYRSYEKSISFAFDLKTNGESLVAGTIDLKMALNNLSQAYPYFNLISFAVSGTISAIKLYWDTLAKAIIKNNNESNKCGTITDINKFTLVFSVWPQK